MLREDVLNFIQSFTDFGEAVYDCFMCGNCYWFAHILATRFNGTIVYDVVANHFACRISGIVYDITGDTSTVYHWEDWDFLVQNYDPLVIKRIYRDCINK